MTVIQYLKNLIFKEQPPRGVLKKRCFENIQQTYRRTPMPKCDFNDDDDDDEMIIVFLVWLTEQKWLALFPAGTIVREILTIVNLRHAASRLWTSAEPKFRLSRKKLCSSDNHCTTAPQLRCCATLMKSHFSMGVLLQTCCMFSE